MELSAKGVNGTIRFDGRVVSIVRSGFLARTTMGGSEKRIPVKSITAVQWKQPTSLVNGYLALTIPGAVESRSRFGSQTVDAAKDENAVLVRKSQAEAFAAVRDAIEAAIY